MKILTFYSLVELVTKMTKPKQVRVVNHPFWKNMTYQEAIDALSAEDVKPGSAIIRPSTKGNRHLSITWKIDDGLYQHIGTSQVLFCISFS
jgi:transcription elongation factor SPT6